MTLESKLCDEVKEHGPMTRDALDGDLKRKTAARHGVRPLRIKTRNNSQFEKATTVLYHPDHHSSKEVIRAYIKANPSVTNVHKGVFTTMLGRADPDLKDAWQDTISDELEHLFADHAPNPNACTADYGKCTFCGIDLKHSLPTHLRKGCPELEDDDD